MKTLQLCVLWAAPPQNKCLYWSMCVLWAAPPQKNNLQLMHPPLYQNVCTIDQIKSNRIKPNQTNAIQIKRPKSNQIKSMQSIQLRPHQITTNGQGVPWLVCKHGRGAPWPGQINGGGDHIKVPWMYSTSQSWVFLSSGPLCTPPCAPRACSYPLHSPSCIKHISSDFHRSVFTVDVFLQLFSMFLILDRSLL
jgi:hypothetical protein